MLELKGRGRKVIIVKGDSVEIIEKSLIMGDNSSIISIEDIEGVEVKKPWLATGFIHILEVGENPSKSAMRTIRDRNTVTFNSGGNYEKALEIKRYIAKRKREKERAPESKGQLSVAGEIMKFKNLLDQGVITKKEFENEKRKLLA